MDSWRLSRQSFIKPREREIDVTRKALSIDKGAGRCKTHLWHVTIEKLVLSINQQMFEIRIAQGMNGCVLIKLIVL